MSKQFNLGELVITHQCRHFEKQRDEKFPNRKCEYCTLVSMMVDYGLVGLKFPNT